MARFFFVVNMPKLPFIQFYPADYLRDTRCLSLAARGVWMDVLCALWNAPKRGQKTLTLEGWAGEIGKPSAEVSLYLLDLEMNGVGKFIHETDGKLTIISRRMLRDERARKCAAKRKQNQRDKAESRLSHAASHGDVTGIYHTSEVILHKSESEVIKKKKEKKEKKDLNTCVVPSAAALVWSYYEKAYQAKYKTAPVRNARVNSQISQFVSRIPADVAPQVAAFYVWHNDQFYVRNMHPVGLLLKDAEALHTQWKTGQSVTSSQARKIDQTQGRVNVFQEIINERKGEVIDVEAS